MKKIFLSYSFRDEQSMAFVHTLYVCLKSQPDVKPFYYGEDRNTETWRHQLAEELLVCDAFVLFLGRELGDTQEKEATIAEERNTKDRIVVCLPDAGQFQEVQFFTAGRVPIQVTGFGEQHALDTARHIITLLRRTWVPFLDIPDGYPFDYEKKIIQEYVEGNRRLSRARVDEGCHEVWSTVMKQQADGLGATNSPSVKENPLKNVPYRKPTASIVVDTRRGWRNEESSEESRRKDLLTGEFTFLEAGPREVLQYPLGNQLTIGVLVSGGIAPGINAVIDGIVSRHTEYKNADHTYDLIIKGYTEGFRSLLRPGSVPKPLEKSEVSRRAELGGSTLGTSRVDELLSANPDVRGRQFDRMVQRLVGDGVEILYVIGGDGSLRAAHAISKVAQATGEKIAVVGIPKTTDNDILWVWQSFGFLSAVEKAREAILDLHTEVASNPRLCVIQLFGSDSGFVVSHAALSSGVCDAALIPEADFTMQKLSNYICNEVLIQRRRPELSRYGVIVMAETAIPLDATNYFEIPAVGLLEKEKEAVKDFFEQGRRVKGQTPDALRSAGLKIVSRVLETEIQQMATRDSYWKHFRVFTNEPRHLLRSIRPSVSDVTFGERLGVLAVDNAMAGYYDFMVSQWVTEYVLVPLKLVTLGRKRIRKDGIFWKSVLASTGQPEDLA